MRRGNFIRTAGWLPVLLLAMPSAAEVFTSDAVVTEPVPTHFSVCHGYGCAEVAQLGLSAHEWGLIAAVFEPAPENAAQERERIAEAIGLFERLIGPRTGTTHDIGGTFPGMGKAGQMDCIDESTNTTTYLRLLKGAGLLRHHEVAKRATRGFLLFGGWPHTTAVIRDTTAGESFAVDAWFEDNGHPAHVVPIPLWRDGWEPPK